MNIDVHFLENPGDERFSAPDVISKVETLAKYLLKNKNAEVTIIITDDAGIKKINKEYRGKNQATDVLSFPVSDLAIQLPFYNLGDIYISLETSQRQAVQIGHSIREEFYRLLVHGFLHLLGYDHETGEDDEIVMKEKEDECLSLLLGN